MERPTCLSGLMLLITTGALLAVPQSVTAQPVESSYITMTPAVPLEIDLELALILALDRSWRMERERLDLRRDRYNLEASRAALKSNASMDFTIPDYDQSIKEIIDPQTGDPRVISTSGARYSSSISIRQPLPTNGVISLNGVMNRTQDELIKYTPGKKTYYGRMYLRFTQPLLQPNEIKMDIRRAELRLERTELSFRDEEISIVNSVTGDFFDLFELAYEDTLAREELRRLESLYQRGQEQYARGEMTESALLQLEVEQAAARDRSSSASGRFAREVADFNQTIGLPLEQRIAIRHVIDYSPVTIDDAGLVDKALRQRSDLRRDEMEREREEMDLREERSRGSLTGDLGITLGLEGRAGDMEAFYEAMLNPDQARGIAVNFSLPLWDWGRNKARVNGILTGLEKMDREKEETIKTIRREVGSVVARIREAESRLTGLSTSVDAARRSYDLSLAQFDAGDLGAQDLLLTQKRFSEARRSYLSAYLDYRNALTDLSAVTTGSGYWGRRR